MDDRQQPEIRHQPGAGMRIERRVRSARADVGTGEGRDSAGRWEASCRGAVWGSSPVFLKARQKSKGKSVSFREVCSCLLRTALAPDALLPFALLFPGVWAGES